MYTVNLGKLDLSAERSGKENYVILLSSNWGVNICIRAKTGGMEEAFYLRSS